MFFRDLNQLLQNYYQRRYIVQLNNLVLESQHHLLEQSMRMKLDYLLLDLNFLLNLLERQASLESLHHFQHLK